MKLLKIIAQELDVNGAYTKKINSAIATYEGWAKYEESVPKLNWRANEASMALLQIVIEALHR